MAIVLGSFIAQVSWSALYVCVSVFYLLQLFLLYLIERTEATRSESSEREGLTQSRCSDAKPGVLENPLLRYCFS